MYLFYEVRHYLCSHHQPVRRQRSTLFTRPMDMPRSRRIDGNDDDDDDDQFAV